jgi:hypothetical protein
MPSVAHRTIAGCCLGLVAFPAFAQVGQMSGPVEFRSADRPITAPALRFSDSVSPDSAKLFALDPPSPADLLKEVDNQLGRAGTRSTSEQDPGRSTPFSKAGELSDKEGLGRSTLK